MMNHREEYLQVLLERATYQRRAALFNFLFLLAVTIVLVFLSFRSDMLWVLIPAGLILLADFLHLRTYQDAIYLESKIQADLTLLRAERL